MCIRDRYVTELIQKSKAEAQQVYQNITFTDAVLSCEKQALGEFSSGLSQLVLDRHSSRYENEAFAYKIFLMAYTKASNNEVTEFFITCYVKSSNGRISKFDMFENVESPESGAIKKGGDKFIEWPQ